MLAQWWAETRRYPIPILLYAIGSQAAVLDGILLLPAWWPASVVFAGIAVYLLVLELRLFWRWLQWVLVGK